MNTRPTPTGHQHCRDVRIRHAPASRFTDLLQALQNMEGGLTEPIVEILRQQPAGGFLLRMSLFRDNPQRSPAEVAAVEGLGDALRFHEGSR